MIIEKWILYKKITPEIKEQYSKFKFGDISLIRRYANEISILIHKKKLANRDYVLFTTHRPPKSLNSKKSSLMLAELVSKKLSLPLIIGNYKYRYQEKNFYDSSKDRKKLAKQFKIHIKEAWSIKKKNVSVIFIDDSIVTGLTLKLLLPTLHKISNKIVFAGLLKIDGRKYSENDLNQYIFTKHGFTSLSNIISRKGYMYTNQMLRTIKQLPPDERSIIFNKLPKSKKVLYEKAKAAYFK